MSANIPKNRTGITVDQGDTVTIEYLDGQWTSEEGKAPLTSGCGKGWHDSVSEHVWVFPPDNTGDMFIGYINNQPFKIGCQPITFQASYSGELYLGMNDCSVCYWDNNGELYVKISVKKLPQPSSTAQQPIIPTEILSTYTPDPSCMTTNMFREMGKSNETKTYVRCPVGQVQYSIQIDDVLKSIILSCPGQPDKNISFSKNQARSDGELLITVDSEEFRSEAGCKVYLTITNSIAEMGYTVWQEVIAP